MSTNTGVLPEKRSAEATTEDVERSRITESPEDSQSTDCFPQGKVAGENQNHNVTGEVSDTDDDMYFDPPGSIEMYSWDKIVGWQPKPPDPLPVLTNRSSTWKEPLDFCFLCRAETGHFGYECPYRCEEIFDNVQCWKKVDHDDNHDYGYPSEPCADCENTILEYGCIEHRF